jgi:hypothetical protein
MAAELAIASSGMTTPVFCAIRFAKRICAELAAVLSV